MKNTFFAIIFVLFNILTGFAATRTWTGVGNDNLWSNPANWGGTAPLAGDNLLFPPGNTRLSNSNNFSRGTAFEAITFTGTNYIIVGNSILLSGGLTNNAASAGNNLFYCPITLANKQTFASVGHPSSVLALNGAIANEGHTLIFAGITFTVSGAISGSGGIESFAGQLLLAGSNTYSGATVVSSGFTIVNHNLALGDTNANTTVNGTGVLGFQNNVIVPEPITVNGKLVNLSGTNVVTGEIALLAASCTVDVRTNSLLSFSNVVSGAGGLLKTNRGTLLLTGNASNTYAGTTTVTAGTLALKKGSSPGSYRAVPGDLIIGDNMGPASNAIVRLDFNHQIADSANVVVNGSGMLDGNGDYETIGSLAGSGVVLVGTGAGLFFGGNGASTAFTGRIFGGPIFKNGTGVFTLTGNQAFSSLSLTAGGMVFDGTNSGNVLVYSNTVLNAVGSLGNINMEVFGDGGGVLRPGLSPGLLSCGNLVMSPRATLEVELNGATPGVSYDQLKVTGGVTLSNATLSATLGFTPAIGTSFTIIDNDGTDAVTNTFSGLPEGARLKISGLPFVLTYTGGSGNDVVLTRADGTRIWSGGGTDNYWTTAANWDGIAPGAGDNLVFPPITARLSNSNNFPGGMAFEAITFTGTNYNIVGNSILLSGGLTNNAASAGNNLFYCPITLARMQTFASVGHPSSVLALNGAIANQGHTLTFAGITFTVSGAISGSGGIESFAGQLLLAGSNTYSGATVVSSGFTIVNHNLALGDTNANTTVNRTGALGFQNNVTVPEPITVNGKLINFSGTNVVTGEIALLVASSTVDVRTNSLLSFSNVVSGAGGLLKTNRGTLLLTGNANNTYAGTTTVTAGTLALKKGSSPGSYRAVPGDLIIGDSAGPASNAIVRLDFNHQIADSANVVVNGSGMFDGNGDYETIGSLAGSGVVLVGTATGLFFGGNGASTAFTGRIFGGPIFKNGTGVFTLTGNQAFGSLSVTAGGMVFDGTNSGNVLVYSNTVLNAVGSLGNINMEVFGDGGGVLRPGLSPGLLNCGNLVMSPRATLEVELNGTTPGVGYDQLKVTGGVTLSNATLSATLGFTPAIGNSFTIIDNDGTEAVTNRFNGLPEGASLTIGGMQFVISYTGGSGNDVVLTQVGSTPLLSIAHTTTNTVAVSWPSPSTGWTLQQNTNGLSSVNWSNAPGTIQDNGSTKTLIVDPPAGNCFYRLFLNQ